MCILEADLARNNPRKEVTDSTIFGKVSYGAQLCVSLVIVKSGFWFKNDTGAGNIRGSCWWFILVNILVNPVYSLFKPGWGYIFRFPCSLKCMQVCVSVCMCFLLETRVQSIWVYIKKNMMLADYI